MTHLAAVRDGVTCRKRPGGVPGLSGSVGTGAGWQEPCRPIVLDEAGPHVRCRHIHGAGVRCRRGDRHRRRPGRRGEGWRSGDSNRGDGWVDQFAVNAAFADVFVAFLVGIISGDPCMSPPEKKGREEVSGWTNGDIDGPQHYAHHGIFENSDTARQNWTPVLRAHSSFCQGGVGHIYQAPSYVYIPLRLCFIEHTLLAVFHSISR